MRMGTPIKICVTIFLKVRSGEIMPRQSRIDKLGAMNYIIFITMGLKLGMCQFAASRAAQCGLTIVDELRLSPEMHRNA